MPKGGRIINVSSIAAKLGLVGVTVYSAAKAAQDSLTVSLAGAVSYTWQILLAHVGRSVLTGIYSLEKAEESP
ncbi:hypothetical protein V1519DRAFT_448237 [Lipomyces tetrasporus]